MEKYGVGSSGPRGFYGTIGMTTKLVTITVYDSITLKRNWSQLLLIANYWRSDKIVLDRCSP